MFFGQYLLAKGIVHREALLDAIDRQRRTNLSVAVLARREGLLDEKQVFVIMSMFRTSEMNIEDACLGSGYLSRGQVDELLAKQRAQHLLIGDALVQGNHLEPEDVQRHLKEFLREERLAQKQLEENFDGFGEKDAITTSLNLIAFHFERIADRAVKLRSIERANGELEGDFMRYAQRVVGDKRFCIAVDLPDHLTNSVAQGLLGQSGEIGTEGARDAACEFVNLVAGNACTHLETSGYALRPEPPFISGGEIPVQPAGSSVRASFLSEDADFDVHLFFEE